MYYDIYTLSLLAALEEYIPFMSEDDVLEILVGGVTPEPIKILAWEAMRTRRFEAFNERYKKALLGQKK